MEYTIKYKYGKTEIIRSEVIPVTKIRATTTFDKEEYNARDTIKATYTISGGSGTYTSIKYSCYGAGVGELTSGELSEAQGTITFSPGEALYVYIQFDITDSNGKTTCFC